MEFEIYVSLSLRKKFGMETEGTLKEWLSAVCLLIINLDNVRVQFRKENPRRFMCDLR